MDEHDKKVMSLITELTKELTSFIALDDNSSTEAVQRYSLSRMYSDKGFRDYLIRSLKIQRAAMADAEDLKGIWVQKGRMEVLAELLGISKKMFEEAQKLNKSFGDE